MDAHEKSPGLRAAWQRDMRAVIRGAWSRVCLATLFVCALLPLAGCGRALQAGATMTRPADNMMMVYVPAGAYPIGSSPEEAQAAQELCPRFWDNCQPGRYENELPRHTVDLDAFWIDQIEVSNAQFRRCVDAGACAEPLCWTGGQFNAPEQPVVCITWHQARDYCAWAGAALPSEAQWEAAARGTDGRLYPWGDDFQGEHANYCDATCGRARSDASWNDGVYYSAPVGSYPAGASWCGALDLAGNVAEWVSDGYAPYSAAGEQPSVPPGTDANAVIRGGSWFQTPLELRAAWRQGVVPDAWFDDIGFRCAAPATAH
ncbi:MAG: formylglycine-generating enzyme family protein [Anaerolineae bacterium]|nr:formylglycine-generating enzyme family protein [Anaerolineae bacterium]